MALAPWLLPTGELRCFFCETKAAFPRRVQADPDMVNLDLRESHRLLWNKPLPDGRALELEADRAGYLRIALLPGRRTLGSDNFATAHANALPALAGGLDEFAHGHLCEFCTIGGYIVFPNGLAHQLPATVNKVARKWTVNQARGMERRVSDRLDLTLEAIRMFFAGIVHRSQNPIGDVLEAYRWWFDLFGRGDEGFAAYVDHFFLSPLVDDAGHVKPFDGLSLAFTDALPGRDPVAYREYVTAQLAFLHARNALIARWWSAKP